MHQDYYSPLLRVIMKSARGDPRLRALIYEIARRKLRRELDWDTAEGSSERKAEELVALETAIARIEDHVARTSSRARLFASTTDVLVEIIPPNGPPLSELLHRPAPEPTRRILYSTFFTFWSIFPFVLTAVLGLAAYVAVERGVHQERQLMVLSEPKAPSSKPTSDQLPALPVPRGYGVYALSSGQLTELESLPIRVNDRGVAIPATISTPSKAKIANGLTQFIAFRRDLANSAPEKVVVRVVAEVKQLLAGKNEGSTGFAGASWIIRDVSYVLKVAPIEGNPAMILIRPADVSFSFPGGRYALVLKGAAYGFSVEGPVLDLAHCVELIEERNTPTYIQCRNR
jgi:hypothetical protein